MCPEGFQYSSDTNDLWLTDDEVMKLYWKTKKSFFGNLSIFAKWSLEDFVSTNLSFFDIETQVGPSEAILDKIVFVK